MLCGFWKELDAAALFIKADGETLDVFRVGSCVEDEKEMTWVRFDRYISHVEMICWRSRGFLWHDFDIGDGCANEGGWSWEKDNYRQFQAANFERIANSIRKGDGSIFHTNTATVVTTSFSDHRKEQALLAGQQQPSPVCHDNKALPSLQATAAQNPLFIETTDFARADR